MIGIFNLNQTLASNSAADPDDTLNAKRALGSLGYYKTPDYGMTKYPDEGLFNGIKSFQKDNNLTKDGVMNPAGETATQLGKTLAARRTDNNPLRGDETEKADTKDQNASTWPAPLQKTPERPKPAPVSLSQQTKPTPIKPLQKAVGRKQPNRAGDVGTAIGQLISRGIYALRNRQQDAVVKNAGLEHAIEAFQQANGLKVDAVMNPGGETEQALLKAPGDQHPPSAPETPSDPGQDDPDEPDGVTPKPPGDQHPPENPEEPEKDDDDDYKSPYLGPCGSLYAKLWTARRAADDANVAHYDAEQAVKFTMKEIQALKDEFYDLMSDEVEVPDRTDEVPKARNKQWKKSGWIVVDLIFALKNRSAKYNEFTRKLAALNAKLERQKAHESKMRDAMIQANKILDIALQNWRDCKDEN